jgi:hypothetical protein
MTLEEKINDVVQKMYLAYESNSYDDAKFYSTRLAELKEQQRKQGTLQK